jgi:hypothetical protein
MLLTIGTGNPITLSNVSFSDSTTTSVYNLTYDKVDLTALPVTFSIKIEDDDGNTMVEGVVSDYVKNVNRNTTITIRFAKK